MSKQQYYIRAYNQKNLYDLTPNEWKSRIIIAQDHFNTIKQTVTKKYFWFKTHKHFIKYLQGNKEKWFYEVFEDQQVTCMYFDLDWYLDCGAFMSPEEIIKEILHEYHLFIGQNFPGVEINLRDWCLLKSSGDLKDKIKYSYHLVDRSGYTLRNSKDRSILARNFCFFLTEKKSALCNLKTKEGITKLPVDLSVYSKWQNFRTIWSSKMNSDRKLLPVDLNGEYLSAIEDSLQYFAAFITPSSKILKFSKKINVDPNAPKMNISSKIKHARKTYESRSDWKVTINKSEKPFALINDGSIEFYLKCIPNAGPGQDWSIYFAIAAAVQREGCSFEIFNTWASQSSKFIENDARILWNSLKKAASRPGYNGGTLRNMAKFCSPELFRSGVIDFQTKLQISEYESEYMQEIPIDKDIVICQSPMGTGKTYGMAQLISKLRPARVLLILSSRLTYTQNALKDINVRLTECNIAFESYEDRKDLNAINFLVIQMESLHKLTNCDSYDLLLIDECEGCLKQFNSNTMLSRQESLWSNLRTFKRLFTTSKRKVFLDAFLSNRTIDLIEIMIQKETSVVLVNKKVPVKRKAIQYTKEKVWNANLFDDIQKGKKVVVFFGSMKKGKIFQQELTKIHPNIKYKYYSSKSNNKDMRSDLSNVRESWKDLQVLLYTSKITVGVNFDEEDIFDSVYVNACTLGCTARDTIQATMRVRHLRENILHYFIDFSSRKVNVDLSLLEYRLQIKTGVISKIDRDLEELFPSEDLLRHNLNVKWRTEEKWMVHLYLQNSLEIQESRICFREIFKKFLERCGYEHSFTEETGEKSLGKLIEVAYNEIPTVTGEGLECLMKSDDNKTSLEKLIIFSKKLLKKTCLRM